VPPRSARFCSSSTTSSSRQVHRFSKERPRTPSAAVSAGCQAVAAAIWHNHSTVLYTHRGMHAGNQPLPHTHPRTHSPTHPPAVLHAQAPFLGGPLCQVACACIAQAAACPCRHLLLLLLLRGLLTPDCPLLRLLLRRPLAQ
jgi:hypothetical protein